MTQTLHVLTPTYRPAGGVVKLMDYATHALAFGCHVSVWCPSSWSQDLPLFQIDRLRDQLAENPRVRFHSDERLDVRSTDLILVSLPSNYELAARSLHRGMSPERIIHLVQNVRHTNPQWLNGYPNRLLTRPAARISVNHIIASEIEPWLDPRALHRVIPLGHDLGFFHKERPSGLTRPIRVAHTTWKSDLGDRVHRGLDDDGFVFRAIREQVSWTDLRELYQWADVFLSTPGPEEGFYMPGLEAMEAGCLVVTPDVGGNMAYCEPGRNCLLVDYEDTASYLAALRSLPTMPDRQVDALRRAAYHSTHQFDLAEERTAFGEYLADLRTRIADFEAGAFRR